MLFLLRREQSVRVIWFELLLPAKQAGFRFPQSSQAFAERSLAEVTRTFTTPEILCWEQAAGGFQRAP